MSEKDNIEQLFNDLGNHRVPPPKQVRRKLLIYLLFGKLVSLSKQYWLPLTVATVGLGVFLSTYLASDNEHSNEKTAVENVQDVVNDEAKNQISTENGEIVDAFESQSKSNLEDKDQETVGFGTLNSEVDGGESPLNLTNSKKKETEKKRRANQGAVSNISSKKDQSSNRFNSDQVAVNTNDLSQLGSFNKFSADKIGANQKMTDSPNLEEHFYLHSFELLPFQISTNLLSMPSLSAENGSAFDLPKEKSVVIQSLSVGLLGNSDWSILSKNENYRPHAFVGGGVFLEAGFKNGFAFTTGLNYHEQMLQNSIAYQEDSSYYEYYERSRVDTIVLTDVKLDTTIYIQLDSTVWMYDTTYVIKADTVATNQYTTVQERDSVLKTVALSRNALEEIKNKYVTVPLYFSKSFRYKRHYFDLNAGARLHFLISNSTLISNPYYDPGRMKNLLVDYRIGLTYGYEFYPGFLVFGKINYSYWQNAWHGAGTPIQTLGCQIGIKYRLR